MLPTSPGTTKEYWHVFKKLKHKSRSPALLVSTLHPGVLVFLIGKGYQGSICAALYKACRSGCKL
eukprot:2801790-Rhodomonas_salina.1